MMNQDYRRTATTVAMLNYHFVFCPRYRRKIFKVSGVEERFKQLTYDICKKNNVEILTLECHADHIHLFVNCPPELSPSDVMKRVKGASSLVLRDEFPELSAMSSLWTRSYFVSTAADLSSETIQNYVNTLKTRPVPKKKD